MDRDGAPGLLGRAIARAVPRAKSALPLRDGARIAVVGGGPAGSLFAYFVCRLARTVDLDVRVDIYEPRSFGHCGPEGCNHCGGVVSESLIQLLAIEGVNLPAGVVRRGLESYVLHTDVGDVRIEPTVREKRIASVFRGNGPRDSPPADVAGFDRFLLELSSSAGANVLRTLVNGLSDRIDGLEVLTPDGPAGRYDVVAVAAGINSRLPYNLRDAAPSYVPPGGRRTFICEFDFGEEARAAECLGDSMHVFLPQIEGVEFAALIPKGRVATLCVLGEDVDEDVIARFLASPELSRCLPGPATPRTACQCFPRINVVPARRPFADRIVWIGDSGVVRLYKDGIGSAYRTAKAAANTVVLHGVGARDFERYFWPECRALIVDNAIARVIFAVTSMIQRSRLLRRGVVRMTAVEQASTAARKPMSSVLWDVFTGSAPYREILMRTLRPSFPATLAWNVVAASLLGGADGAKRRGRS